MDLGISGRRAAVAAASAGLGLGCARALVREGVDVAVCGRRPDRVEAAVAGLRAEPGAGRVEGLVADVGTADGAGAFVDEAAAVLGGVDILVANAGGPPPGTFASTDLDAYGPALQLNLLSTVAMCRAAVPAMAEQGLGAGRGHHVDDRAPAVAGADPVQHRPGRGDGVPQDAGHRGGAPRRHGQLGAARHPRHRPHGAALRRRRVERPRPGSRSGGSGDADDFGAAVAFLCSARAGFVTGTTLLVDGGAYPGLA